MNDIGILIRLATQQLANEAGYMDPEIAAKYGGNYTYAYINDCQTTLRYLAKQSVDDYIGVSACSILRVIEHYRNNVIEIAE